MRAQTGLLATVSCACGYLLILFLVSSGATSAYDASVLLEVNRLAASQFLGFFAAFVTQFGADVVLILIALLVFVLSRSNRELALKLVAVVILSDVAVFLLRTAYVRPRPDVAVTGLILPVGIVSDPSFPSGHATRIFAFACVVVAMKGRKYFPALILGAAVATSRVVLGLHYPLDVVAGAILGISLGVITVLVDEKFRVSQKILRAVGLRS